MAERRDTLHIALLMILGYASISPLPLWAESQSNPALSAPPAESHDQAEIRKEFLAKVAEASSIARKKEALIEAYTQEAYLRNKLQDHLEKLESQTTSLRSAAVSPSPGQRYQLQIFLTRTREFQYRLTQNHFLMDTLVAEYDVLSRMEELEGSYRSKGITKADFAVEDRNLREQLAHIHADRQMNYFREDLVVELVEIERQILSMSESLRSSSAR
ncbi:MAG: hypothetical protein KF806_04105 [Nitrospira sp.]|uniref:hypothetical protein n=1 Tax=Nitrosomonas sp. TaxID=42353 RepID=UPI001DD34215|nr:hypothetical protein [Nitrosomonas sp.]MBX3120959.1 hypothetical protein [Fimbriimonadaceae bacterium]MBX3344477.1 hypothetical protein [Nitrospira sp.]MBX3618277.1 hypothetical protein [Nitrosomonas sp.]